MKPFCGAETIANYNLDIFKRANVELNHYLIAVLFQTCSLVGYLISACIMTRVKRKHHFVCSTGLMGIFLLILGFALNADVRLVYKIFLKLDFMN